MLFRITKAVKSVVESWQVPFPLSHLYIWVQALVTIQGGYEVLPKKCLCINIKSCFYTIVCRKKETRILSIWDFQKTTIVKNLRFILKQTKQFLYLQKQWFHHKFKLVLENFFIWWDTNNNNIACYFKR